MFLPLTTRGHHLPSSWTHLHLSLLTFPAVPHHHGLLIQLTPATLPVHIRCLCVCYCGLYAGDTCTVLAIPVSQPPTCFVFCRVGFLFFIKGLPCNWIHTSFLPRAPSPCLDSYECLKMGNGTSARKPVYSGVNLPYIFPKLYSKMAKKITAIVRITVNRNQLKERANL